MDLNEFAAGLPAAQTNAPWQCEVAAMETAAKALEPLNLETRARVLRWLAARFVPDQAFLREPGKVAP